MSIAFDWPQIEGSAAVTAQSQRRQPATATSPTDPQWSAGTSVGLEAWEFMALPVNFM